MKGRRIHEWNNNDFFIINYRDIDILNQFLILFRALVLVQSIDKNSGKCSIIDV